MYRGRSFNETASALSFPLLGRVPGIGRLPGDFTFSTGGFTCFFPLATSIILSIVLTILLNIVARTFGK